jgi:ankyrin repeat protein
MPAVLSVVVVRSVCQNDGWTVLHVAALNNATKCLPLLLEAGADASRTEDDGRKAYDLAAEYGWADVLALPGMQGDDDDDEDEDEDEGEEDEEEEAPAAKRRRVGKDSKSKGSAGGKKGKKSSSKQQWVATTN